LQLVGLLTGNNKLFLGVIFEVCYGGKQSASKHCSQEVAARNTVVG